MRKENRGDGAPRHSGSDPSVTITCPKEGTFPVARRPQSGLANARRPRTLGVGRNYVGMASEVVDGDDTL